MRVPVLPLVLAMLLVVPAADVACISAPPSAEPIALATHVSDWRDEVIYQAITDRFANGDVNNDYGVVEGQLGRYQGGDWKGLEDHLAYLEDLGVTTIWISPIVKNVDTDADLDGYHGYWAQDLYELNPHFGDLAALRSLTSAAHARGMKVVLDIVTNHMGQLFFYDINLNGKPDIYVAGSGLERNLEDNTEAGAVRARVQRVTEFDPDFDPRGVQAGQPWEPNPKLAGRAPLVFLHDPMINRTPPPGILGTAAGYHGLGRILDYNIPGQVEKGDFPGGLKDVATENPEVRATMVDAYARWVELADFDGLRIDTVKHVEPEFWQVFTRAVHERLRARGKKNFLLFGEAWDGDDTKLGAYTQSGMLDSLFYFSQHYTVFQNVFAHAFKPADVTEEPSRSSAAIAALWEQRPKVHGGNAQPGGIESDGRGLPPYKALVNFIDNHDVPRFLFEANGDTSALRNALTLLFTEEGIPCLYYGTELDFAGGNDPANREVLFTTGFPRNGETFRHIARLARIRRLYPALRRGDTAIVYNTEHTRQEGDAGILAYERAGGDAGGSYALVVLNTNGHHESTTASEGKFMRLLSMAGRELVDVLDPLAPRFTVEGDGTLRLALAPQRAMILVPSDQVKELYPPR